MSKFFLFGIITWLTGSPLMALLVLIILYYILDRRFIGILPSMTAPLKRNSRLRELRNHLRTHVHDTAAKLETARLLIAKKKFREAEQYLRQVQPIMEDSAEVLYELGLCRLKQGDLPDGKEWIERGLEMNPRVAYGDPYLRLGEAFAEKEPENAVHYLQKFRELNSSSCEAYYRLGQIYARMGKQVEAKEAYRETVEVYRSLPKYKRRSERRFALLASFRR
ncbi:tetratricopeptide repeat protein [Gorillibacterium timonense]|uniref:tetratricopeptide repeat protein n=1 Tax=Gorillibacterium timonense TaxID=1689269 RepID=UPI0009E7B687|nr:tetratricopeptide repeat protein [Gorillibacterium timonense]